jgi:enhancing lycopene biosynthesis protein 2
MRIGVLLGGCGHYDGTDACEAVLTLLALEAAGEKPVLIAPAIAQQRTVDHLSGDAVEGESRDVLRESARLFRGRMHALADVRAGDLEALIIPGGYGPVVNFATGFAQPGQGRALVPKSPASSVTSGRQQADRLRRVSARFRCAPCSGR